MPNARGRIKPWNCLSLALPVQPFKLPQNVSFHWCVSWFRSLGCVDEDVVWGFTLNKVGCFLSLGLGLFSVHHLTPRFVGFQRCLVSVGGTPSLAPGRSGRLFPSIVFLSLLSFLLSFYGAGNWVQGLVDNQEMFTTGWFPPCWRSICFLCNKYIVARFKAL